MEDTLIELLQSFGYDVILQGSLAQNERYPEHFFTYWENPGSDTSHYDNAPTAAIYDYDVNFYSTNADMTYSVLREAKKLLVKNGFTVPENGHTVGSDEPSHTGRGMNVFYRSQNI